MKKIVSFSLWCQKIGMDKKIYQTGNMYCNGSIQNLKIKLKENIYKDWIFRFYINDTVPIEIQKQLKELGAELIDMTGSKIPGMYWRFLPFDDKTVDIFIVRDTDSRINLREEKAVEEWLKSDKILHVMRDHPHHYYKILGGMWGYKNYIKILNVSNKINNFLNKKNYNFKRMDDMIFLNSIYDSIDCNDIMEHDEFFNFKNSRPFPDDSYKNDYYHFVGEIFDENNNCPNKVRDIKLLKNENYKKMVKLNKNINFKK